MSPCVGGKEILVLLWQDVIFISVSVTGRLLDCAQHRFLIVKQEPAASLPSRAGQGRAEQGRAGPGRAEQGRAELGGW